MLKVFPLESLHKGASIEFGLEASNAFSHPTFGQPATDVDDPLFGTDYVFIQPAEAGAGSNEGNVLSYFYQVLGLS